VVDFPDYSNDEMAAIFLAMLHGQGYRPADDLAELLPAVMARIDRGRGFANGRSVRSLVEQLIERQSLRLAGPDTDIDTLPEVELTLLMVADLPPQYHAPTPATG
jgi:hypothetical protein